MQRFKNTFGFTLVEILAAIILLGTISVSVSKMFAYTSRVTQVNERRFIFNFLMQRKIEEVKAKPFGANVDEIGFNYGGGYSSYVFSVTQMPNFNGNPDLKQIYINCVWPNVDGNWQYEDIYLIVSNI